MNKLVFDLCFIFSGLIPLLNIWFGGAFPGCSVSDKLWSWVGKSGALALILALLLTC